MIHTKAIRINIATRNLLLFFVLIALSSVIIMQKLYKNIQKYFKSILKICKISFYCNIKRLQRYIKLGLQLHKRKS
jgi:choline-glycine betaine transporter